MKPLSLETLGALEPRDAAAHVVARRSEGLAASEQGVVQDWLAADPSHHVALARAESAWRLFDRPADHEILTAMRAHALASRPRAKSRWLWVALATVAIVSVTGILFNRTRGRAPDASRGPPTF